MSADILNFKMIGSNNRKLIHFNVSEIKRENDLDIAKNDVRYWKTFLQCLHGLTSKDCRYIFGDHSIADYLYIEKRLQEKLIEAKNKVDSFFPGAA